MRCFPGIVKHIKLPNWASHFQVGNTPSAHQSTLCVSTSLKQHPTTSHNLDGSQHLHPVQTSTRRSMSPSTPERDQIPPKGKGEVPANPPGGRTTTPDSPSSASHQGRGKRADSRSVSRGRTHRRSRNESGRRTDSHPPEDFVYPSPTGGFAPKGRALTASEAAYLSDAPHLDYKSPARGRKGSDGAVKSPKASHIRMEMEACAEMTGAGGEAAEARKGTNEATGKSEEH